MLKLLRFHNNPNLQVSFAGSAMHCYTILGSWVRRLCLAFCLEMTRNIQNILHRMIFLQIPKGFSQKSVSKMAQPYLEMCRSNNIKFYFVFCIPRIRLYAIVKPLISTWWARNGAVEIDGSSEISHLCHFVIFLFGHFVILSF